MRGLMNEPVACLLLVALAGADAHGQCDATMILAESGGGPQTELGCGMALDGGVAVISTDDHRVFVFRRDGRAWTQEAVLAAKPGSTWDDESVAISGDVLVIGGSIGPGIGAAFVYRRGDDGVWRREAVLQPGDPQPGDFFGDSVAIEGDVIVVGAPEHEHEISGVDLGYVYVFRFDGTAWSQEARIHPKVQQINQWFGADVAISDTTILIGAPYDDDLADDAGAAYVFEHDGADWLEQARLLPTMGGEDDHFGFDVALDGDLAVIGRPGPQSILSPGAAHVFRGFSGVWVEEVELHGDDESYAFGTRVATDGDRVVIRASDFTCSFQGAAYVFGENGGWWFQEAKVIPDLAGPWDRMGTAVAVDGDLVLISNPGDDEQGDDAGAVLALTGRSCQDRGDCLGVRYNDEQDDWFEAVGAVASIAFTGYPPGLPVTSQYTELGATFDGMAVFDGPDEDWPNDGWGMAGFETAIEFSSPMRWIGAVHTDALRIDLYDADGELIYASAGFGAGSQGGFAGLVMSVPFHSAVITAHQYDDELEIDDLFFGPGLLEGDLDGDGLVDVQDLTVVLLDWGCTGDACAGDANGDGVVGVLDLMAVVLGWTG